MFRVKLSLYLALSLAILFLLWSLTTEDFFLGVQCVEKEYKLRLMTYNIRKEFEIDKPFTWEMRRDAVASIIKWNDADVIGLQEPSSEQVVDLAERLGDNFSHITADRCEGQKPDEHVTIFWDKTKYELLDNGRYWASKTPDIPASRSWNTSWIRATIWAFLRCKRSNVHFYYFNAHVDHIDQANLKQTKLNLRMIANITKGQHVVYYGGDFNTFPCNPNCPSVALIEEGRSDMLAMDNTLKLSETGHYGSMITSSGFLDKEKKMNMSWAIDYLFMYTPPLQTKLRVTRHGSLGDRFDWYNETSGKYLWYHPSDHLPVLAEIVLSHKACQHTREEKMY